MITCTVHSTWLAAVLSAALASYALGDTLFVPSQYSTIQAAIDAAQPSDEVVIADGTYTGPGNKNLDFGGKDITVRSASGDPNACIIDCEDSGIGVWFYRSEREDSVLAGLTITRGRGSQGGGVFCYAASPTITNCVVRNSSALVGGGIACMWSDPVITNCIIIQNHAYLSDRAILCGGGIYCERSDPHLSHCIIADNIAGNVDDRTGLGGGIYCCEGSAPMIDHCTVGGNTAAGFPSYGGGLYCVGQSHVAMTDTTISSNLATAGGGIHSIDSDFTASACRFETNLAWGGDGGGMLNTGRGVARLRNCVFLANSAGFGGGMRHAGAVLELFNCRFLGNHAGIGGGGIDLTSGAMVAGCTFVRNGASGDEGMGGGAIHCYSGSLLANCTFVANHVDVAGCGGAISSERDGGPTLRNCVLWENTAVEGGQICDLGSPTTATYSCVEGGWPGVGNINSNPLFVRNPGPGIDGAWDTLDDDFGDLRLLPDSPCSDAGDNAVVPPDTLDLDGDGDTTEPLPFDLGGRPRFADITSKPDTGAGTPPVVDMGAYESQELRVPAQYATIQAAIDAAQSGDSVVIADGTYTGPGNKNLDFGGKNITVRSASGDPTTCIIDCEQDGRAFYLHTGETEAAVISGLRIVNGLAGLGTPGYGCGGGIYLEGSSPILMRVEVLGCDAELAAGGVFCWYGHPVLQECVIAGNWSGSAECGGGGGVACLDGASPTLIDCMISDNVTSYAGGGECGSGGGGIFARTSCKPSLFRCMISGNRAYGGLSGGGIYLADFSDVMLVECAIDGNQADSYGGGLYCAYYSNPAIANCTISGNKAGNGAGAGACCVSYSSPVLTNCILWGDAPQEIGVVYYSTPAVTYCNVQGGWPGIANIDADPLFVRNPSDGGDGWGDDPSTPDIDEGVNDDFGDLRLQPASPCIDAGDNAAVSADTLDLDGDGDITEPLPIDLGGRPRFADISAKTDTGVGTPPIVDLGAYESQELRVPAQYATIQAAIDAAQPGDSVVIADGTYTGPGNKNLDFGGKGIRVRSASGDPNTCIIDCEGSGRGFYLHSGETLAAVLDALTVRSGLATDSEPDGPYGGALFLSNASATLTRCRLETNNARSGGAVALSHADFAASDCLFAMNVAHSDSPSSDGFGGAIKATRSQVVLTHCTFNNNFATGAEGTGRGGAVSLLSSEAQIGACWFESNSASAAGGGVFTNLSSLSLIGCQFSGNTADSGAGVCFYGDSQDCLLSDCTVVANEARVGGGGALLSGGHAVFTRSSFQDNRAYKGGAVELDSYTDALFLDASLERNFAQRGAALYCVACAPVLQNTRIDANAASEAGGALYCWGGSAEPSGPTLADCTVVANTAPSGAAIHCGPSAENVILTLSNTIVWSYGTTGFTLNGASCVATYCDIQGGWAGAGNIDADPLFVRNPSDGGDGWGDDPSTPDIDEGANDDFGDLHLLPGSPCIDAGNNASVAPDTFDLDGDGNTTEPLPFDLDGYPRFVDDPATPDCPYAPGTCGTAPIVDMGTYEYQVSLPRGDVNCDGQVNINDVLAFVLALIDPTAYVAAYPGCNMSRGDMNADGSVNGADIQTFVDALLGD